MQSFASLPEEDRWALAFHAGGLAYPRRRRAASASGATMPRVRALVPDLAALVALTPAELEAQDRRRTRRRRSSPICAPIPRRSTPPASAARSTRPRPAAREPRRLSRAATAAEANELALSAYLDGFEPVEAVLATRDGALMRRVEQAMAGFRAGDRARRAEPPSSPAAGRASKPCSTRPRRRSRPRRKATSSTFLGAFAILLREGLEALLVVIAMIAFLRKAERAEALPYVHGGWVAALVAGVATWARRDLCDRHQRRRAAS